MDFKTKCEVLRLVDHYADTACFMSVYCMCYMAASSEKTWITSAWVLCQVWRTGEQSVRLAIWTSLFESGRLIISIAMLWWQTLTNKRWSRAQALGFCSIRIWHEGSAVKNPMEPVKCNSYVTLFILKPHKMTRNKDVFSNLRLRSLFLSYHYISCTLETQPELCHFLCSFFIFYNSPWIPPSSAKRCHSNIAGICGPCSSP